MYLGWLSLGGTEIVNSSRTYQYAKRYGLPLNCADDCPDLAFVLGDSSYQTGFDVPWDDPTQPPGFLGFIAQSVTGMSNGTIRNFVTDLAGDGSAIGTSRRGRRELLIQVMAVGLTNSALDYGIAWLNSALRGAICDPKAGCSGSTLCFYDECPSCDGQTADECNTAHLKTLFNVGVLEPPTVVRRHTLSGVCDGSSDESAAYAILEYTLVAGIPYIYSQPELVAETSTFTPNSSWFEPLCPDLNDCATDPDCPAPSSPPPVPVPVEECTEHLPGLYDTQWLTVASGSFSEWFEKVPYIEVYSGDFVMRSLAIRFAANPAGLACGNSTMLGCAICSTVFVPYIPEESTLVVDGRIEKATITCNAGEVGIVTGVTNTSETIVYDADGGLFEWPKFECSENWCIQVQIHADWHAPDSTVKISMVERKDSA